MYDKAFFPIAMNVDSGIRISRIDQLQNDSHCITLQNLLSLDGTLESMVQFNFMFELDWFLANVEDPTIPITFVTSTKNITLNVAKNRSIIYV